MRLPVEHQDVAGGQVAVDDAGVVQRRERVGEAAGEGGEVLAAQRAAPVDEVVEPGAGHEAGDEVGQVGVDVGVEHLDQVRASHPSQRVELVTEAAAGVRVGEAVAQDLDGHCSVVAGHAEKDRAHAALAEATEQAVRPDAHRVGVAQGGDGHSASPGSRTSGHSQANPGEGLQPGRQTLGGPCRIR